MGYLKKSHTCKGFGSKGLSCAKALTLIVSLLLLPLSGAGLANERYEEEWVNIALNSRFQGLQSDYGSLMSSSYLDNNFQYLWMDHDGQPNTAAKALIKLVTPFTELAEEHPWLAPYKTFLQRAQQPLELPLPRYLLATDLLYSDIFARIQQDLASERFIQADSDNDHRAYGHNTPAPQPLQNKISDWQLGYQLQLKTAATLDGTDRSDYLTQQIEQLYPHSSQSKALISALDFWRAKQEDDWPQLAEGESLMAGEIRPDWIPVLIQQLQKLDLLSQDYTPELADRYDDKLVEAVKKVQAQHGQKIDGIIGPKTRKALNLTPKDRVRQLAHNFRRLYHLPQEMGEQYVMVNMADYRLQLIKQGQESLSMKVIVGTPKARTPIMTQTLTSVILSPRWNVPRGIANRLIFPQAKADPNYLRQRGIIVVDGWSQPVSEVPLEQIDFTLYNNSGDFPYRFVQLPGNNNLLGYVKFRLSNNKAIYMHDTPGKHLFEKTELALSNGCIRLEKALLLADHLLTDYWNSDRVQSILSAKEETYLPTAQAELPVYLMYWTVWQDENGQLQWRDDVYYKDQLPPVSSTGKTLLATTEKQGNEG